MASSTMTSKGQITLPKEVRDELGLVPGSRVSFERNSDGDYVLSTSRRSIRDLTAAIDYRGRIVSLDEMDEAIAAEAADSSR